MKNNAFARVFSNFWQDSKIIALDPTSKYLFLYLLTADGLNSAGVIDLSLLLVSALTGIDPDGLAESIRILQSYELIQYSPETSEVLILNYGRYNWNQGSTPQRRTIRRDIDQIKNEDFKEYVADKFNDFYKLEA